MILRIWEISISKKADIAGEEKNKAMYESTERVKLNDIAVM
tara:strand:- start:53 stop:175 length:123 start_codon:yes stop_codon:yes gene_type:complete